MSRQLIGLSLLVVLSSQTLGQEELTPPTDPMRSLALAVRKIGANGRLLYVTAHPDDEDNAFLAYHALGRGFAVTLLTVTRGDGGQNEIGVELFEALGVLRMQELRAAHRYDGAEQRFTRAFEFGYSFSEEETFEKWGEEEIVKDIVTVIREVRPHVIVTMPQKGEGGGRHHQASARLAAKAFHVAALDQWPELGAPHATDRIFQQHWQRTPPRTPPTKSTENGSDESATPSSTPDSPASPPKPPEVESLFTVPVHHYDPVLGCTWNELGFRARSFHKCQGTGQVGRVSERTRKSTWKLVSCRGAPPTPGEDLFAGLPVYGDLASQRRGVEPFVVFPAPLDPQRPEASRSELLALAHSAPQAIELADASTPRPRDQELARALAATCALEREALATRDILLAGGRVAVSVRIRNGESRPLQVHRVWLAVARGAAPPLEIPVFEGTLLPHESRVVNQSLELPPSWRHWTAVKLLREGHSERYLAASDRLPTTALATLNTEVWLGGLVIPLSPVPVVHRWTDPVFPAAREVDLVALPSVEVLFDPPVIPAPRRDGERPRARVSLVVHTRSDDRAEVVVSLGAPRGVGTEVGRFVVSGTGTHARDLDVALPNGGMGTFDLTASLVTDSGLEPAVACRKIDYPHIRRAWLERPAEARIVGFPCVVPPVRVGYVTGSGDSVDTVLERLGLPTTRLGTKDLATGDLSPFDVIVTGVRAYKVRDDLKEAHPRIVQWMEDGGRLVVLYNKEADMNKGPLGRGPSPWAPYAARVGRARTTVEESPVVMKFPDHPWFKTPNALGPADFEGWVQERGLYYLETRDERFLDLLEMEDPWEANRGKKGGALVTAPVGKGSWTYVGLALFRQLPAGVPGAHRLLMNILATPSGL